MGKSFPKQGNGGGRNMYFKEAGGWGREVSVPGEKAGKRGGF